jgi:hypothetical protein
MSAPRVAFLVGAGLSQPYGVPTMKPFYDQFRAHVTKNFPSCLPALDFSGPTNAAADLESVISGLQSLIQTRQTLAQIGQPEEQMPPAVRAAEQAFGYLSAYVIDTCERFDRAKAQKELTPLIKLMADHSCWCFTTNYDRIPEVVAASMGLPVSDGFETQPESTVGQWTNAFAPEGLRLAKLHGSVTWYEDEEEIGPSQVRLDRGYALPAAEYRLVRLGRSLRPLMIIPTLEKDLGRPPYAHLVARLLDALAATQLLVIIGSSLRDTHLQSYIETRQRENGMSVLLVDPAAESLMERFGGNLKISPVPTGVSELATFAMGNLSALVSEAAAAADRASVVQAVERFVQSTGDVSAWASEVARSDPEVQIAARIVADHSGTIAERTRAVAKLGDYHHPVVIRALVTTALTDPSAQVRTMTIAPLLRRGSPDAIDTVKRLAYLDEDENVRLEAMLGLFHDAASVDRKQLLESVQQTAPPASALREIAGHLLQKLSA